MASPKAKMYVVLVLLLALLAVSIILDQRDPTVMLSLEGPRTVSVGEPFEVAVYARGATDLAGSQFSFTYDESIVEYVSYHQGELLSKGGDVEQFQVDPKRSPGRIDQLALVRLAQGGVQGSGDVVILQFQAVHAGTTTIHFADAQLTSAPGTSIPVKTKPLSITVRT